MIVSGVNMGGWTNPGGQFKMELLDRYVPPNIGDAYGGGYLAGYISTTSNSVATHYLIVSPKATGEYTGAFSTGGTSDPTSVIDGPANSATMNNAAHMAAQFCENLTIGGYTDWYLPAFNELEICYYNLRPFGGTSTPGAGINPNAVPARTSGYSESDPATSVLIFKAGGTQAFSYSRHWSSTQNTVGQPDQAQWIDFFTGAPNSISKTNTSANARAVRRVAI